MWFGQNHSLTDVWSCLRMYSECLKYIITLWSPITDESALRKTSHRRDCVWMTAVAAACWQEASFKKKCPLFVFVFYTFASEDDFFVCVEMFHKYSLTSYSMFSNIIFASRAHFSFAPRAQQTHEEFMLKEEFHWDSDIRCHYNIFRCFKGCLCKCYTPISSRKSCLLHIIISVVQVFRFAICFLWAQCSLLVYRE